MPILAPVLPDPGDHNWGGRLNTSLAEIVDQVNINTDLLEITGPHGLAERHEIVEAVPDGVLAVLNDPNSAASVKIAATLADERVYGANTYAPKKVRQTATSVTASLADKAEWSGTFTLGKSYRLLSISTDRACRVRLYATAAQRDADAGRAIGTDPTGNHGLLLEYVSTATVLAAALSPFVDGASLETVPVTAIPALVQNLSGATSTTSVSLTYLETE